MSKYFGKIFGGLLFILININIETFDIIPDFIGYFLVAAGTVGLFEETKDIAFRNASFIAGFLGFYELIGIFIGGTNVNLMNSGHIKTQVLVLMVVGMLVSVHMFYYLYSGMIRLCDQYEATEFSDKLLNNRNSYIYFMLFSGLCFALYGLVNVTGIELLLFAIAIIGFILSIRNAMNVRRMQHFLEEE